MSYLALYRKYRPSVFDDVVGQEHIVRTLQNQIKTARVAHAYLFTGSRGTGKTSIAKIFARAVNCQTPVNGSACGECENCERIRESGSINIIEIDAASHNGVDNIREINEEVRYTPAVGKYKVYIIDEVHMLSTGAFNALLKTLEEPPGHVIFILATTDPQKIPVTILSRCQRFDFARIKSSAMKETLSIYMEKESIKIDDEALDYITRLADGGMRDALSLLEKCISFYFDEAITLEKVLYLVGAVDYTLLFDMVDALTTYNSNEAIMLCEKINNQGRSIRQFVTDLLVHIRNLLVAKTTHSEVSVLDYSREYIERLSQQGATISVDGLMHYIKALSELDNELKVASNQKIVFEVAILRLCEVATKQTGDNLLEQLMALQKKVEQLEARGVQVVTAQVETPKPVKEIKPLKLPDAVPDDLRELASRWENLKNKMGAGARIGYGSTSAGVIEGDIFYIVHGFNMEPAIQKYLEEVKQLINEEMQKEVKVVPISVNKYEAKVKETHGTHPAVSDVTASISDTLRDIQSKLKYDIKTID